MLGSKCIAQSHTKKNPFTSGRCLGVIVAGDQKWSQQISFILWTVVREIQPELGMEETGAGIGC